MKMAYETERARRIAALDYVDAMLRENPYLTLKEAAARLNAEKYPRPNGEIGTWYHQCISNYYHKEGRCFKPGQWKRFKGVTRIANMMFNRNFPAEQIAEYLNIKGYRTKNGNEWQAGNVKSLLKRIKNDYYGCNPDDETRYYDCDKYSQCLNNAAHRNLSMECQKSCYRRSSIMNIAREISGMEEMAW